MGTSVENVINPDLNKHTQEVIFSRKLTKSSHPQVFLNDKPVSRVSFQKHLGTYLDDKLYFNHHIKEKNDQSNERNRIKQNASSAFSSHNIQIICKAPS